MSHAMEAPGQRILSAWRYLSPLPGGRWLFSRLVGVLVPYSGSIHPSIEYLEPGRSRVVLQERRAVRNHLHSVHAIALANLGELSTGLAVLTALPIGTRGIVTHIGVEYRKKARGALVAEGLAALPALDNECEHRVGTEIRDAAGDTVARVEVDWKLGPVRPA